MIGQALNKIGNYTDLDNKQQVCLSRALAVYFDLLKVLAGVFCFFEGSCADFCFFEGFC